MVETVLERIRPALNADGGDIETEFGDLAPLTSNAAVTNGAVMLTTADDRAAIGLGARSYPDLPLDERLRRIEAEIIGAALVETGGNKSKAALRLGIKRSTLGDRIGRCADYLPVG